MKTFVKDILNEARVLRTIDSKIWASMSSTSSKNRANLAADIKPMKKDDVNTLLQKYVAGLLTIKASCPSTETDINKIKSYHLIGQEYLNQGGTLSAIQKLYVENGGSFEGVITSDDNTEEEYPSYDEVETEENNTEDYPSYDEVEAEETSKITEEPTVEEPIQSKHNFDNMVNSITQNSSDNDNKHSNDDIMDLFNSNNIEDEVPVNNVEKDYPEYDEVEDENVLFSEQYDNEALVKNYIKSLAHSMRKAREGQYLVWNKYNGLELSNSSENAIAKCVLNAGKTLDKKSRFMLLNTVETTLGNAGNNGVYDDYYFKKSVNSLTQRLSVTAGSNYYFEEEVNGKYYTDILADNGNNAAIKVKELLSIPELNNNLIKVFNENVYLPTLPELTSVINKLKAGSYWTSSITAKGTTNIVLGVNPDQLLRAKESDYTATVVGFITF